MLVNNNQFTKRHARAVKAMMPLVDDVINVEPRVAAYNQQKYQKGIYFPIICNDVIAKKRLERVLPISQNYVSKYQLEGKKVLLFVGRLVVLKNVKFALRVLGWLRQNIRLTAGKDQRLLAVQDRQRAGRQAGLHPVLHARRSRSTRRRRGRAGRPSASVALMTADAWRAGISGQRGEVVVGQGDQAVAAADVQQQGGSGGWPGAALCSAAPP